MHVGTSNIYMHRSKLSSSCAFAQTDASILPRLATCLPTFLHASAPLSLSLCLSLSNYIHIYKIYIYIDVHVNAKKCIHVYLINTHTHTCICTYVYIYMYIYIYMAEIVRVHAMWRPPSAAEPLQDMLCQAGVAAAAFGEGPGPPPPLGDPGGPSPKL